MSVCTVPSFRHGEDGRISPEATYLEGLVVDLTITPLGNFLRTQNGAWRMNVLA